MNKLETLVFKVELKKSYDKVHWFFMRLILLQIGLPLLVVDWIMAYLTTSYLYVLVNKVPTSFLNISRGLMLGFPLSPLYFLLVVEGFSRIVICALRKGF